MADLINDYASKTRIGILCKKMCCAAPHYFLSLISFEILGMIEPWPECQPEESRPGSYKTSYKTKNG